MFIDVKTIKKIQADYAKKNEEFRNSSEVLASNDMNERIISHAKFLLSSVETYNINFDNNTICFNGSYIFHGETCYEEMTMPLNIFLSNPMAEIIKHDENIKLKIKELERTKPANTPNYYVIKDAIQKAKQADITIADLPEWFVNEQAKLTEIENQIKLKIK